jgi:hypothetical protein
VSLERGNAEIHPEPDEAEREAILEAVRRLQAEEESGDEPSSWWRAGREEGASYLDDPSSS